MIPNCLTCKHFVRYYIRMGEAYSGIDKGHCRYPRPKQRDPHVTAYTNYLPASDALSDWEWRLLQGQLARR